MAFYSHGHIYPLVPKILESHEHIEFVPGEHKGKLGTLIDDLLAEERRKENTAYKVIFLSAPDSPVAAPAATASLGSPISKRPA